MIHLDNHLGSIVITKDYLTDLVATTVCSCFGVAGISNKRSSFLRPSIIVRRKGANRGIRIQYAKKLLSVELHIFAIYGMNLTEIVKSITNKVRFTLEEATGEQVSHVSVFIDGIKC